MTKPHLSETNFRKWEPILFTYFSVWPEPYAIDTRIFHLAPTTVAARIRDAKLSLKTYGWPTNINQVLFLERYEHIQVLQTGPFEVTIRDRDPRYSGSVIPAKVREESTLSLTINFANRERFETEKILEGLSCLHHYRVLPGPSFLENLPTDLGPRFEALTSRYDIAFTSDPNHNRTILT